MNLPDIRTMEDINELLTKRYIESEIFDFKRNSDDLKWDICAMANNDGGGQLVLGIDEDKNECTNYLLVTLGDAIQYICTDAAHSNPLRRVTPAGFIDEGGEQVYDKEKYCDMLLEATETVLGYFGFDRALYGYAIHNNVSY
jgi:hypothetical protein